MTRLLILGLLLGGSLFAQMPKGIYAWCNGNRSALPSSNTGRIC